MLGTIGGILGLTGTGIGIKWNAADVAGSFASGANWAWCGGALWCRLDVSAALLVLGCVCVARALPSLHHA